MPGGCLSSAPGGIRTRREADTAFAFPRAVREAMRSRMEHHRLPLGPTMSDIGLTHVALPVHSLAASTAFYAKYAGMQAVHSRPGVVWVSDRTRPFAVVLIETSNEIKPLLPMAHLGVGVRSREEVDRL